MGEAVPFVRNVTVQLIVVARAVELIDTGETTAAQAMLYAAVKAYAEGGADREDRGSE